MRTIKALEKYPPLERIFEEFADSEMPAFLDSSLRNGLGQYSIIGLFPYLTLVNGDKFTVNGEECGQPFEKWVKEYLKNHQEENPTGLPMISGAIGYFSYDYGRKKEGVKSRHEKTVDIPECILCFYDVLLVEDHREEKLYIIANGEKKDSGEQAEELACQIQKIKPGWQQERACETEVTANFQKEEYLKAIDDVRKNILEGDIYVMNLTQQLTIRSKKAPYEVFKAKKDKSLSFWRLFSVRGFSGRQRFSGAFSPDEKRTCRDQADQGNQKAGGRPPGGRRAEKGAERVEKRSE